MTTEESVITPEMKEAIGVDSEPVSYDVEKGAIKKFAQAIGDDNPLFNDEQAARKSRYGGIIASPTFMRSLISNSPPSFKNPYSAALDGGSEWEYFEPVRAGDRITVTTRIADTGRPLRRATNTLKSFSENRVRAIFLNLAEFVRSMCSPRAVRRSEVSSCILLTRSSAGAGDSSAIVTPAFSALRIFRR